MIAESALDGACLSHVAGRRRGAVRIDVLDLIRIQTGVVQRDVHALGGACAVLGGRGHVIGVGVHADTDQFGIDGRAARLGVLVLFEYHDTGAVAEHEAVTVLVERTAGGLGIVVAGREGARGGKATETDRRGRHLGAAGQHHVDIAVTDHERRLADVVRAGRAGRDDGIIGAFEAELDREIAGHHVDDVGGHEEGRDPARPLVAIDLVIVLDAGDAADAGTHGHTDAPTVGLRDLQSGIGEGLRAGRQTVMDELVHLLGVFFRDIGTRIEAIDRTAEAGTERGDIEVGDRFDAALSGEDVVPRGLDVQTNRRHKAQSGDYYPSAYHHLPLSSFRTPRSTSPCRALFYKAEAWRLALNLSARPDLRPDAR